MIIGVGFCETLKISKVCVLTRDGNGFWKVKSKSAITVVCGKIEKKKKRNLAIFDNMNGPSGHHIK